MISTLVILAVTSNVVLSLGMVGALSIVRFRTAIKEPLDIAFLFWSIAVGIVLAAGMIPLAVFGSLFIGIVLLVFANRKAHLNPYIVVIRCAILAATLVLTVLFMNAESLGIQKVLSAPGYETRLFDTSKIHTLNIVMDDWDEFIESCTDEEYAACSVVIDNEAYKNVAIRAKGNTSLANVQNYGNDRYSFKIEFDHYDSTKTYYGLDKLSLNNIIQDNTYMKDYLTYQMMGYFGVNAPLCSYVQILVNGEEWGLYLAIEGVEESFLSRNYGNDYGELYKPDSMSMGGGQGDGMQGPPLGDGRRGMTPPDHNDGQTENQVSPLNFNSYIMLGVCAVVLLVGLLSALLYKKRV